MSSLAQRLVRRGGLDARTAAQFILDAVEGLCVIHRRSIIHRDVKPGNMIVFGGTAGVGGPERLKLADFGASRVMRRAQGTMTVGGTPQYVAPEVASGHYDSKADVYSIGVSLLEVLAVCDVPGLGEVLRACTAAAPQDRPTAQHLFGDLYAIIVRAVGSSRRSSSARPTLRC